MDTHDWLSRWREGRIGFHEGHPNALLAAQVARLDGRKRVLVPLCGKAEDMAFLAARGMQVVGVELSRLAVTAFFEEHGLTPTKRMQGSLEVYESKGVTLLCGDFFAVRPEEWGGFDAFYDRAALVALPREVRERYVPHLRSLLAPGAAGLVVTFEYPQEKMEGPPFSVPEEELRARFGPARLEPVGERPAELVRLRESGSSGRERCFFVQT